ncbi:hypothetical protein [Candidatus Finniella inopinata]|uniref:Right-handed parallel beta-helix repeat-containing protein n=1 Tax=Candidatus Finniella inopinata TaxID=1696036 RepID=A0A4V2DZN3_9PROT|nr:hypothetical protein [Candidatus Finniella inopinata]RZI45657.1 hypothetical protein EQU50_06030 [Candidatus Finniella inopinata]
MKSSVFLLGVSLSAFSAAYGATVQLYDSSTSNQLDVNVSPATIANALTEAAAGGRTGLSFTPTTRPYIVLTGDDTAENSQVDDSSSFTDITIASDGSTVRVIKSSGSPGSFGSSTSNDDARLLNIGNGASVTLNNVTFHEWNLQKGVLTIANGGLPGTLNIIGIVLFQNNKGDSFPAIDAYNGLNLNINGSLTLENKSANGFGGAIYMNPQSVSTFTCTSPTSQLIFRGNNCIGRGGAVYAVANSLTITSGATFTGNFATGGTGSARGGAIYYDNGNLALTDTVFSGNYASAQTGGNALGGAVYMKGKDLTYRVSVTHPSSNPLVVNPDAVNSGSAVSFSNNDIACESNSSTFTKSGPGTLVLNTNNSNWLGDTVVSEGTMIVGHDSTVSGTTYPGANAVWGPSSGAGNITVGDGTNPATLGGSGTINANTLTLNSGGSLSGTGAITVTTYALGSGVTFSGFSTAPALTATNLLFNLGSTWKMSAANPLIITGALTLPSTLDLTGLTKTTYSAVAYYPVASFGSCTNLGNLTTLNSLLLPYSLQFVPIVNGNTVRGLSLQTQVPTVSLSSTPSALYYSLHDALRAASQESSPDTAPSITLTTAALSEPPATVTYQPPQNYVTTVTTVPLVSDLSSCSALTITGVLSGSGTTISPALAGSTATAANPLRLFYTSNPLTVTLNNITFKGFYSEDCHYSSILGGSGNLSVTAGGPVTFDGNSSSYGGAVRTEGTQTFNGVGPVTFQNNKAFSGGGGVFCTGTYGNLTFNCPTAFTNNQSIYEGGAINTQISVGSNSIVINNTATFTGNTAVIGGASIPLTV